MERMGKTQGITFNIKPANNDILQYDLASNRWVNTVLSISGASEGFAVGMAIALG